MTLTLTDELRQDPAKPEDALGYFVPGDGAFHDAVFAEIDDARRFAEQRMEMNDAATWNVFPLWAGEPITIGDDE